MAQTELRNNPLYSDPYLKAYWRFEGNSADTSPSASVAIGTDTAVTYSSVGGQFQTSSVFNGSTSKIVLANSAALRPPGLYTVSAWVKIPQTTTAAYRQVFYSGKQATYVAGIEFRKTDAQKLQLLHGNYTNLIVGDGYQAASSTASINTGVWTHIAGRWDGTHIAVFVNGVKDGEIAYNKAPAYDADNRCDIGINNYTGSTFVYPFDGSIDDLSLFGRGLTDAEILSLYRYSPATPGWLTAGGAERKKLTIPAASVSGSLHTQFPMWVDLTDSDLSTYARSDGTDINFTDDDGVTILPHQLMNYTSGTLKAWVRVPILRNTAATDIYMYFGNASPTLISQSGSIWESNYYGVWHMNEPVSAGADGFKNSAGFRTRSHLTPVNLNATASVTGKLYRGIQFPGVDGQYLQSNTTGGTFDLAAGQAIHVSYWCNQFNYLTNAGTAWNIGANNSHRCQAHHWNDGNIYWDYGGNGTAGGRVSGVNTGVGKWSKYDLIYKITGTLHHYFIDGVSRGSRVDSTTPGVTLSTLQIGGWSPYPIRGQIEEFRLHVTDPHSDGWIKTEYDNQNSPATFYSLGVLETSGSVPTPVVVPTVSGSLTISPTQVAFNGSRCLLSWVSTGAERVSISGLGTRPVNGSEYVYVTSATVYTATFTNDTDTIVRSAYTTVAADPATRATTGSINSGLLSVLSVDIVRNINAGQTVVNARRTAGDGTPSYIISSRTEIIPPPPTSIWAYRLSTAGNAAASYARTNNAALIPTPLGGGSDSFTLEFWHRMNTAPAALGTLIWHGSWFNILVSSTGRIKWAPQPNADYAAHLVDSGVDIVAGEIHHYAFVADTCNGSGYYMTLYKDGVAAFPRTFNGKSAVGSAVGTLLWIGGDNNNMFNLPSHGFSYLSDFDEVRFWNINRTQAAIQATKNSVLNTPQTNLIASWQFDVNPFTTDSSGQENTLLNLGTVTGSMGSIAGLF